MPFSDLASLSALFEPTLAIAREAGAAILQVYGEEDVGVTFKDDKSPLTRADLAAHQVIVAGLQALTPAIPVLSEESVAVPWDTRRQWQRYWLVDPLDGTKEFIKRNGEFTVNIALIDQGDAVLGAVYVPVQDVLYGGLQGGGAWKWTAGRRERIEAGRLKAEATTLRVVASRSHKDAKLAGWLAEAQQYFPDIELVSMGSSLKICVVAEGMADVYPRLGPTSEWDTAAAQAVLEAAGGRLIAFDGRPYRYNTKENLLNPNFLALGAVDDTLLQRLAH
ncbi:MAG TPA: 3'(2'),5'-bisphosphate nucleotidase CysQ [Hyphomicrobiales bacterium]|nr:3'(2'),5'-bisphosphate nucleotidase CysQ [Hyphomicrobiales bacterium]